MKSPLKKGGPVVKTPEGKELLEIPISLIRPFPDQPRRSFNQSRLMALGESMRLNGQRTPVTVKRITGDAIHQFELVDGERRLRASILCNLPTLIAYVEKVDSPDDQFISSVTANFNREPHTHLEITYALKKMFDIFTKKGCKESEAIGRIATVVAYSEGWVYQYLGFLRLEPEVRAKLDEGKISFQIGVALTNFVPESQKKFAQDIVDRGMTTREALHYIRSQRSPKNLTEAARSSRSPNKDYHILIGTLKRLAADTDTVLDMGFGEVQRIFRSRTVSDVKAVINFLKKGEEGLGILKETMEELLAKMNQK